MSARFNSSLRYSRFIALFHRQYRHVDISPTGLPEPIASQDVCYCQAVNSTLPADKSIVRDLKLPHMVPAYKRHVLLISPKNDKGSPPVWKSSWQSKLELNPTWPYSSISTLKNHLKRSTTGSGILVNAISIVEGNIKPPERNDRRLHFYVMPEMRLYKILESEIESFAHYLGGEADSKGKSSALHFEDYLQGADNANIESTSKPSSSNEQPQFDFKNIIKDWILICGHHQRDPRCGVVAEDLVREIQSKNLCADKNVGIISHIGGHKYAGNMIFYNHVGFSSNPESSKVDALWFGKVLPSNLQLLLENINHLKIPEHFYRGGIQMN